MVVILMADYKTFDGLEKYNNEPLCIKFSSGKDSSAVALHAMELGLNIHSLVYLDTGWEHQAVYDRLDWWENKFPKHPLIRLQADVRVDDFDEFQLETMTTAERMLGISPSPMVRYIVRKMMFSFRSGFGKWCTNNLKTAPYLSWLKQFNEEAPISAVGVRRQESENRRNVPIYSYDPATKEDVWRLIATWTFQDVIDIHKRHKIKPNNLYMSGVKRVGCWPCVQVGKEELRLVAELDPQRIAVIRYLEERVNLYTREKFGNSTSTFFMASKKINGSYFQPVDKFVEWSKTRHGGKELLLFRNDQITSPCSKWGMCNVEY